MNRIKYIKTIVLSKLLRRGNAYIVDAFRKEGMKIGDGTHIFSNIITSEPYLRECHQILRNFITD